MEVKRNSLSPILIGLAALAFGCGDSKSDDGGGNSGATGGTASGGSSGGGSSGGGMPGTGGVEMLAGRGGSSGPGGSSGASAGWAGSAGSPPVPESFPTGFGPVETVLDGLTNPARLQLHDGYLYFTEIGALDVLNGRLARISPTGVLETLLTGQDIAGMYLDEDELFVSERGTRKVFRMPYATLTPELFYESDLKVADMERIGERIWMTFFNDETPRSIAVYGLDRTTKERSDVLPLTTGASIVFTYLSAAGDNLYLSTLPLGDSTSNNGFYKRSPSKVGVTVPGIWANHTSTDASYVYFGDQTSGIIFRQAHTADNQPEVLATGQAAPYHVQVASDGIYWSNSTNCDASDTRPGSIQALPLGGGTPVPVATNEACPGAVTTDPDYVYWTRTVGMDSVGADSIVRASKLR